MAPWLESRGPFITFMVKPCYIYDCSVYFIYGQILLHMWLVDLLNLWLKIFTFMVSITFITNFYYIYVGIPFMVGITFMVFITFMGDTCHTLTNTVFSKLYTRSLVTLQ